MRQFPYTIICPAALGSSEWPWLPKTKSYLGIVILVDHGSELIFFQRNAKVDLGWICSAGLESRCPNHLSIGSHSGMLSWATAIMPCGQKGKLCAGEKCRHDRAKTRGLKSAQSTTVEEEEATVSSCFALGDAPPALSWYFWVPSTPHPTDTRAAASVHAKDLMEMPKATFKTVNIPPRAELPLRALAKIF